MIRKKSNFETACLYVVSTPIGNKKELSPRALEILSSVAFIASEDTRTTGLLLKDFAIHRPFLSYHQHNERKATQQILQALRDGKSVALTSDAGYPGISDPGSIVIQACIENGFAVSVINGANAFLPALIGSGLSTEHFYFHGFLDPRSARRKKEIETLKLYPMTLIFYESPHRILETLQDFYLLFGNRNFCLVREITKLHEEYIYGTLEEASTLEQATLKGEMVLIIEGYHEEKVNQEDAILEKIEQMKLENKTSKEMIQEIMEIYNIPKNQAYAYILSKKLS